LCKNVLKRKESLLSPSSLHLVDVVEEGQPLVPQEDREHSKKIGAAVEPLLKAF